MGAAAPTAPTLTTALEEQIHNRRHNRRELSTEPETYQYFSGAAEVGMRGTPNILILALLETHF